MNNRVDGFCVGIAIMQRIASSAISEYSNYKATAGLCGPHSRPSRYHVLGSWQTLESLQNKALIWDCDREKSPQAVLSSRKTMKKSIFKGTFLLINRFILAAISAKQENYSCLRVPTACYGPSLRAPDRKNVGPLPGESGTVSSLQW
jgi:hypothetical protein